MLLPFIATTNVVAIEEVNQDLSVLGWTYEDGGTYNPYRAYFSTYPTWQDYLWYFKKQVILNKGEGDTFAIQVWADDDEIIYVNGQLVYNGTGIASYLTPVIDITNNIIDGLNDISLLNDNGINNIGYGYGGFRASLYKNGVIILNTEDFGWWNVRYTTNIEPPNDEYRRSWYEVRYGVLNSAPMLNTIGDKEINEGELLEFIITATDEDVEDVLTFSAENLPEGATFNSITGEFSWMPNYDQSGIYENIQFSVIDSGEPVEVDTEVITITIANKNRPAKEALQTTVSAIESFDAEIFKNKNSKNNLISKIEETLTKLNAEELQDSLNKLMYDVLKSVDGCAFFGVSDSNDAITVCDAQFEIFLLISEAIGNLEDQLNVAQNPIVPNPGILNRGDLKLLEEIADWYTIIDNEFGFFYLLGRVAEGDHWAMTDFVIHAFDYLGKTNIGFVLKISDLIMDYAIPEEVTYIFKNGETVDIKEGGYFEGMYKRFLVSSDAILSYFETKVALSQEPPQDGLEFFWDFMGEMTDIQLDRRASD